MRERVPIGVALSGGAYGPRGVVAYSFRDRDYGQTVEAMTQVAISRMLTRIKGYEFAAEYDSSWRYLDHVYYVPSDTLVGIEAAHALGIRTEDDLFGGVVPHAFVGTKAITHPLVDATSACPVGWSHRFPKRVRDVVLPGFTAFTPGDTLRAGARLLNLGPIRLKPAGSRGGRSQTTAADLAGLEAALVAIDPAKLSRDGLVVEQNLREITTYSVGQTRVGGLVATYAGTQRRTTDSRGAVVYGGSDLLIVRGSCEALLNQRLTPEAREAVAQARAYDAAASQEFPGLIASRRNYDVVRGRDAEGRWRTGVLEQSWRIGGASGPEIAAIAAFHADPELRVIRASCTKTYGTRESPPPGAILFVRTFDDRGGPVTKYTIVEPYVRWLLARSGQIGDNDQRTREATEPRRSTLIARSLTSLG